MVTGFEKHPDSQGLADPVEGTALAVPGPALTHSALDSFLDEAAAAFGQSLVGVCVGPEGLPARPRSVSSGSVSEALARWLRDAADRLPPPAFKLWGCSPQFAAGDTSTACSEEASGSGSETDVESELNGGLGISPVAPDPGFEAQSLRDIVERDRPKQEVDLVEDGLGGESSWLCSQATSSAPLEAPVRSVPAALQGGLGARVGSTPSLRFGSKLLPGERRAPRSSRASLPLSCC